MSKKRTYKLAYSVDGTHGNPERLTAKNETELFDMVQSIIKHGYDLLLITKN